jgi:hypothetical protein
MLVSVFEVMVAVVDVAPATVVVVVLDTVVDVAVVHSRAAYESKLLLSTS